MYSVIHGLYKPTHDIAWFLAVKVYGHAFADMLYHVQGLMGYGVKVLAYIARHSYDHDRFPPVKV